MNDILHLQHRTRLSWNRDFLSLDEHTGKLSTVKLNLLQRILRIALGSLASLMGFDAFYTNTIFSQKRITRLEQTKNYHDVFITEKLVRTLERYGKKLSFQFPALHPLLFPSDESPGQKMAQNQALIRSSNYFSDDVPSFPQEVLTLLLSLLDLKDIARMRQVNQSWNQLICDNTKFLTNKFIDSCYAEATKILVSHEHADIQWGFEGILQGLVDFDIAAARRTVRVAKQMALKIKEEEQEELTVRDQEYQYNDILLEIAKTEAHYDIEAARQTISTVTEESWSNDLLFYIILHIEKDFSKAKKFALAQRGINGDSLLTALVQKEAETNIPAAIETLESIREKSEHYQAKVAIIKRLAQTNINEAKKWTLTLADPFSAFKAELAIAQHDPEHNFKIAIEIAEILGKVYPHWDRRDNDLAKIAVIQNRFDPKGSQATVALIPQDSLRSSRELSDRIYRLIFLKHAAVKNMWEAKTLAHSFDDPNSKVFALIKLAKFAIKGARVRQVKPSPLQNSQAPG